MYRLLQSVTVSFLALTWCTPSYAEIQTDWRPKRTWVFAVGLLKWQYTDIWSGFPEAEKNRRDVQFVEHFKKAGVPEEQITYLQDAHATKKQIQREFKTLLDQTDEGDLLIFYFCGHGYRDRKTGLTWFANYDAGPKDASGWNVRSIFETIDEHFSGDRVLMLADCCHSGALYDEARARRDGDIMYAAITSSYSHNSSTGNWTFTDSLLAALRGRPVADHDGNGIIELNELARYTELEMAFVEGQKSMFTAHEDFPIEARMAGVNGTAKKHVGERIEGWWNGKWYKARVIDASGDQRKVHWLGYGTDWDMWLMPDHIRPYQPKSFAVGAHVQVKWSSDNAWYPGTVVKSWNGLHLVHYDGFSATWDEWVGPGYVRQR